MVKLKKQLGKALAVVLSAAMLVGMAPTGIMGGVVKAEAGTAKNEYTFIPDVEKLTAAGSFSELGTDKYFGIVSNEKASTKDYSFSDKTTTNTYVKVDKMQNNAGLYFTTSETAVKVALKVYLRAGSDKTTREIYAYEKDGTEKILLGSLHGYKCDVDNCEGIGYFENDTLKAGVTYYVAAKDGSSYICKAVVTEEISAETKKVTFVNALTDAVIESKDVVKGKAVTKPSNPVYDGYDFVGWYTTNSCTDEFNFSSLINEDTNVYAKFVEKTTDTISVATKFGETGEPSATKEVEMEKTATVEQLKKKIASMENYYGTAAIEKVYAGENEVQDTDSLDKSVKYTIQWDDKKNVVNLNSIEFYNYIGMIENVGSDETPANSLGLGLSLPAGYEDYYLSSGYTNSSKKYNYGCYELADIRVPGKSYAIGVQAKDSSYISIKIPSSGKLVVNARVNSNGKTSILKLSDSSSVEVGTNSFDSTTAKDVEYTGLVAGTYKFTSSGDETRINDIQFVAGPIETADAFVSSNATLKDDVILNFYLKIADATNKTVKFYNANSELVATSELSSATPTNPAYDYNYVASCHVAAQNISDVVTAVLYDGDSATEVKAEESVKEYLASLESDATYGELATSLETYGDAAKIYFQDGSLTTEQEAAIESGSVSSEVIRAVANQGTTATYAGDSLLLNSKISLRFYFNESLADKTVTVSGGAEFTKGDKYVDVVVTAANLDTAYTVTINGETSATQSAMGYARDMFAKSGTSNNLKYLMLTLANYYAATK